MSLRNLNSKQQAGIWRTKLIYPREFKRNEGGREERRDGGREGGEEGRREGEKKDAQDLTATASTAVGE